MMSTKAKSNTGHALVCASATVCVLSAVYLVILVASASASSPMGLGSAPPIKIEHWTASDLPYKSVERQIAKDYADGRDMRDVLQQWKLQAKKQPKDPITQLAVAFAARGVYRVAHPDNALPYSLVEMLAKYDPGNVHEYIRMRFCMTEEAERQLPIQNAEAVGKQLLQYNPQDTLVRTNLIYMLCDSGYAPAAMPYALKWVKAEPKSEKAHSSLALVYQDMWFATKDKQYGRLAVQEYQQFLKFAQPNDGFRALAQNSIKVLSEDIAKQT